MTKGKAHNTHIKGKKIRLQIENVVILGELFSWGSLVCVCLLGAGCLVAGSGGGGRMVFSSSWETTLFLDFGNLRRAPQVLMRYDLAAFHREQLVCGQRTWDRKRQWREREKDREKSACLYFLGVYSAVILL